MQMNDKIFAVVNPLSSNGRTGKEWPQFEKTIKDAGISFDWQYTNYPLHAIEITGNALKAGYNTIISVGGDGTMNEVLNGFFENGNKLNKDADLTVFSRGTGCDFIRTLGMENSVENLINILKSDNYITCDIGLCNFIKYDGEKTTRYFLNVSDVGIGGETTYRVNRNSKALKGFLSFLIGTVSTIIVYKNKNLNIIIDDEIQINERINTIIIANGRYFGGGMHVAPLAKINDGVFDIIILGDFTKAELIANFPKIYKGTHLKFHKVRRYLGKSIKVSSPDMALVELDGEQPGTIEAEYQLIPEGIKVRC
ncbi:MAG: diacylglycerol kinase family lipid kinase [Clostridiales bacterium]|nr:diacylglycerol kinase family lipid kinase [Clostridiales bacterium]